MTEFDSDRDACVLQIQGLWTQMENSISLALSKVGNSIVPAHIVRPGFNQGGEGLFEPGNNEAKEADTIMAWGS